MHPSRRRKKRPNYGVRTVEVARGPNGFGFTISGQQPCILSCIVNNSPADQAGLRAGDFLISVNGVSVSKITHDAVVSLIGNCVGAIKMSIAENYYSDSSDEELECGRIASNRKPKYMHKPKVHHRVCNKISSDPCEKNIVKMRDCLENQNGPLNSNIFHEDTCPNESQVLNAVATESGPVEFKAIVGYLGTIEMPKQLMPNSRLQTVCSCIRKLRQEKRSPTPVLMTILPTCLTLKNSSNNILAIYPTNRVVYVGSSVEKDSRYFGLVTSAINDNRNEDWQESKDVESEIDISNSCHIFVVDSKIVNHHLHANIAENFKIVCTNDGLTDTCLEFPQNALYIINVIQSMYKLQSDCLMHRNDPNLPVVANSPQPSASSNSDSGIGFRDDCGNVSDRILVVEFPQHHPYPILNTKNRPQGINGSEGSLDALELSTGRENLYNSIHNNTTCSPIKGKVSKNGNVEVGQLNDVKNIRACEKRNRPEKPDCVQKESRFSRQYNYLHCRAIIGAINATVISNDNQQELALIDTTSHCSKYESECHNPQVQNSKISEVEDSDTFRLPLQVKKVKKKLKSAKSCENIMGLEGDKHSGILTFDGSKVSLDELNNFESFEKCGYGSLQNLCKFQEMECQKRNNAQSEPDIRIDRNGYLCDKTNEGIVYNKGGPAGGPSSWATSFEKLLEDPVGLHSFAEFLKKEFSAENIYFWTACERYARLPADSRRTAEAQRIFKQHLALGAPEAVNVDAHGRQAAEQDLVDADTNLFEVAQKQIFNLMKFDSYPRFLKSQLYKQCLAGDTVITKFDPRLALHTGINSTPTSKLKKSLSNAEDRRRKSLLPWHRKNNSSHQRSKSRDREESSCLQKYSNSYGADYDHQRTADLEGGIHSSQSSLTSLDFALSNQENCNQMLTSSAYIKTALCRVRLSSGSTTVVQIKEDETVQQLVQRLLDKRGLVYSSFEVFTNKHPKALNISESSLKLAGCEVTVEQRVVFKLDLPNRKIISVKSRYSKIIADVLRPTLHKYKFNLEQTNVTRAGCPIDISLPVTSIDMDRLNISLKEGVNDTTNDGTDVPILKINNVRVKKLEEITNKVFESILQEKSDIEAFKPSKSDKGSVKSEDWGSEHSSGIFGKFLRRDSAMHERKKKLGSHRAKACTHGNREESSNDQLIKKPLIAKLKVGPSKQVAYSESDELVEGLTRAQRRLEDQRGTEINFELPDFLKDKEEDGQYQTPRQSISESNSRFYTSGSSPKVSSVKATYENVSVNRTTSSQSSINKVESMSSRVQVEKRTLASEPPPLPPKPKVIPIKPPNWGQSDAFKSREGPGDVKQDVFLDQPTSSFV
ncbi:regulator of G-protein signaling loco [Cylas formicarius]|uniref:regulator of G-protein signaling loco n=1 Tax=Cylas formicarius TaxID=197179 RepID=UPI0029584A81|nr:regulator of G-protein signaling loco [Cylas formicarius]